MTRRNLIAATIAGALGSARAIYAESNSTVRGKLTPGDKPSIEIQGRRIALSGDEDTMKVLADDRLKGSDFEASGRYESQERFAAGPMGEHALAVYEHGKKLFITYWCSNCSVRYIVPGPCLCCGLSTDLQLRDSVE